MPQGISLHHPHGDTAHPSHSHTESQDRFPFGVSDPRSSLEDRDGYFDIRPDGARSPASCRYDPLPIGMVSTPTSTAAALTALQYLPIPVLVLSSLKTVVLANEAMGRLLGIDVAALQDPSDGPDAVVSITDILRGQSMAELGVDILQHGSPIWISWEDFLDSIVDEGGRGAGADNRKRGDEGQIPESGESTPTTVGEDKGRPLAGSQNGPATLSKSNLASTTVVDASVEVIITSHRDATRIPDGKHAQPHSPLQANMIISIWNIEEVKYFTLTFTSASPRSPSTAPKPSSRTVARTTTSVGKPYASSNSSSSGRRSIAGSTLSGASSSLTSPVIHTPTFLPSGPPSSNTNSSHSVFQKASQLKDAILNSVSMPAYAMWKDESFGIPNKALISLLPDVDKYGPSDQRDFLGQFTVWTEDFKTEMSVDDFPVIELCRTQTRFEGKRIGMRHPRNNTRIVFEVHGEPIYDDRSGDFIGGIVIFKDVTEYTKRIAQQIQENERQFEYIANLIPIMVWRTTPTGAHDWFSQRWYDYTGLTEEESLGLGWKNPFHPEDMPATQRRWAHSLATGEEYFTEYRCLRHDGMWRWMLGRAVPFYDDRGTIVKWFGTCTDIHELVEARQTAKDTREQLQRVIEHAQVTLWAVNTRMEVTLLEGKLLRHCEDAIVDNSHSYVGRHLIESFGNTPMTNSVEKILNGTLKDDLVEMVRRLYQTVLPSN